MDKNTKIIEQNSTNDIKYQILQETLTDKSKVYNVRIDNIIIGCTSKRQANTLYKILDEASFIEYNPNYIERQKI